MSDIYSRIEQLDFTEIAGSLLSHSTSNTNVIQMHYGALPSPPNLATNKISLADIQKLSTKYNNSKGSLELRTKICNMYKKKYSIDICPKEEIILTNGCIEALSLSILSTTEPNDKIVITNPTYTLFSKTISTLNRIPLEIERPAGNNEYANLFLNGNIEKTKCFIMNSPENPTGYTSSKADWEAISKFSLKNNTYIVHDEVFGLFDINNKHTPALGAPNLKNKAILVNSFSKMLAAPGIKIGWMIAPKSIIKKAIRYHNYCYLGVNPISEKIANTTLDDQNIFSWIENKKQILQTRRDYLVNTLKLENGYKWPRQPQGGFSLTPNIELLYQKLPEKYKNTKQTKGTAVAKYLFYERNVSVSPACIYGSELNDYIKISITNTEENFLKGASRLCDNYTL